MPCVKMPSASVCSNRVCAQSGVCACARRDVGCVKRASARYLSRSPSPRLIPSFAACAPQAQHHLSSLSHLSPGPIATRCLPSRLTSGPLELRSFSLFPPFHPSCLSFSTSFPPIPRPHIQKRRIENISEYPCARHGSPRGLAFKSRVPRKKVSLLAFLDRTCSVFSFYNTLLKTMYQYT